MSRLTVEDIIATTGMQQCENIIELEILFNSFDEISSLEYCLNLKKLTLLDNGLKKISNLSPVSLTLTSLCLCDQKITKMENLELPMLRELHLHRNDISEIRGLSSCPRLRKLWLFQNKLTQISGLHSLPELQECWLQANQITHLDGFEHNQSLEILGLAGNPVSDVDQIRKLCCCSNLRDVSFSDIHFGRSPIVDCVGYKEFMILHLRQVHLIDGIKLSQNGQMSAEDAYFSHVQSFNSSLEDIEEAHIRSITAIQTQFQSKEIHSLVLEKEMSSALRELQSLVMSGAQMIGKQVARNQSILSTNYDTLINKIHCLESDVSYRLRDQLSLVNTEFDASCAVLAIAEYVTAAESALTSLLSTAAQQVGGVTGGSRLKSILYQPIVSSSADFQLISSYLNVAPFNPPSAVTGQNKKTDKINSVTANTGVFPSSSSNDRVELVRLYRVSLPFKSSVSSSIDSSLDKQRVFALITFEQVEKIVKYGWKHLSESLLFSTHNGLLTSLLSETHGSLRDSKLGAEFLSALQSHHIVNGKGNSQRANNNLHNNANAPAPSDVVNEGFKLQDAMNKKVVYVICCKLAITNELLQPKVVTIPSNKQSRESLLTELYSCRHAQGFFVEGYLPQTSNSSTAEKTMLYVLPSVVCDDLIEVDFVALCLTPPLEDGVHTIENKLEMLALPGNQVDSSRALLSDFEDGAAGEVKQFIDRVLFEIDESQSNTLMKAEKEVVLREAALKKLRDEVEKERKLQEGALREMRMNAVQFPPETNGGNSKKNPSRK